MTARNAVVFGAGAVGRGFVGPLFSAAGWHVTFVDVLPELVDRLNADGGYHQVVVDNAGHRLHRIAPVTARYATDADTVTTALVAADFAATAVGAANMPLLAPAFAAGLRERHRAGRGPLDVLLCENLPGAPAIMREALDEAHGGDTAALAGLVATSIGRMIPSGIWDSGDPTAVAVEPYAMLPYDAAALLTPEPDVAGLEPIRGGFEAYAVRKLYVHNMGHCMLAWLAQEAGLTHIADAAARLGLRHLVQGAMIESTTAVAELHGLPGGALLDHVNDLLHRFQNQALKDTAARVGQDPVRKMQPDDRLLGAHRLCRRAGVAPLHISLAIALGARRLERDAGWSPSEVDAHLEAGLFRGEPDDDRWRRLLTDQQALLREGLDVDAQLARMGAEYAQAEVV